MSNFPWKLFLLEILLIIPHTFSVYNINLVRKGFLKQYYFKKVTSENSVFPCNDKSFYSNLRNKMDIIIAYQSSEERVIINLQLLYLGKIKFILI